MQFSTVTWDTPLDEPPKPTDDVDAQAPYVYDMVYDIYFPEPVDPRALRQFCKTVGYPWQPVRVELLKRGVNLPRRGRPRRARTSDGENVPTALTKTPLEERDIGTFLHHQIGLIALPDDAGEEPGERPETCVKGIGGLLSHKDNDAYGRDTGLGCKAIGCPVCGPKKRGGKVEHIMETFAGRPIYALLVTGDE